ncbi:DUF2986 domain-containing protein [Neptunicella marina]|uniref:DUF2986 domain-containing protein n=1 Tax=Neptunicella marina TaxID=2125989 RepID=A0A8J6ITB8_9ALTE|nr:DUF2986 domain-containing protein [Neptunicella marina]MBC3766366.1 DUF2986 domain-containing protein [Neptunicella marina]
MNRKKKINQILQKRLKKAKGPSKKKTPYICKAERERLAALAAEQSDENS